MTRQRKEIYKKMDELYDAEQADYEMGCGFFAQKIAESFKPEWDELYTQLAATYGLTLEEYIDREHVDLYDMY